MMTIKDPSLVHAAKRGKNFTVLAVLVAFIVLIFAGTLVRMKLGQ
jgi:hypothetical protein